MPNRSYVPLTPAEMDAHTSIDTLRAAVDDARATWTRDAPPALKGALGATLEPPKAPKVPKVPHSPTPTP